jgi:hypothetical protein
MFSRRRVLWRLWRLERATTRVLDHRLAYLPHPILSGWELRIRSLSAASFRSITRSLKEVNAIRVL